MTVQFIHRTLATILLIYTLFLLLNKTNYKYILFREKDGLLQYAYNIPYRRKLKDGDPIFIRNKISTFGPFIFYKF